MGFRRIAHWLWTRRAFWGPPLFLMVFMIVAQLSTAQLTVESCQGPRVAVYGQPAQQHSNVATNTPKTLLILATPRISQFCGYADAWKRLLREKAASHFSTVGTVIAGDIYEEHTNPSYHLWSFQRARAANVLGCATTTPGNAGDCVASPGRLDAGTAGGMHSAHSGTPHWQGVFGAAGVTHSLAGVDVFTLPQGNVTAVPVNVSVMLAAHPLTNITRALYAAFRANGAGDADVYANRITVFNGHRQNWPEEHVLVFRNGTVLFGVGGVPANAGMRAPDDVPGLLAAVRVVQIPSLNMLNAYPFGAGSNFGFGVIFSYADGSLEYLLCYPYFRHAILAFEVFGIAVTLLFAYSNGSMYAQMCFYTFVMFVAYLWWLLPFWGTYVGCAVAVLVYLVVWWVLHGRYCAVHDDEEEEMAGTTVLVPYHGKVSTDAHLDDALSFAAHQVQQRNLRRPSLNSRSTISGSRYSVLDASTGGEPYMELARHSVTSQSAGMRHEHPAVGAVEVGGVTRRSTQFAVAELHNLHSSSSHGGGQGTKRQASHYSKWLSARQANTVNSHASSEGFEPMPVAGAAAADAPSANGLRRSNSQRASVYSVVSQRSGRKSGVNRQSTKSTKSTTSATSQQQQQQQQEQRLMRDSSVAGDVDESRSSGWGIPPMMRRRSTKSSSGHHEAALRSGVSGGEHHVVSEPHHAHLHPNMAVRVYHHPSPLDGQPIVHNPDAHRGARAAKQSVVSISVDDALSDHEPSSSSGGTSQHSISPPAYSPVSAPAATASITAPVVGYNASPPSPPPPLPPPPPPPPPSIMAPPHRQGRQASYKLGRKEEFDVSTEHADPLPVTDSYLHELHSW